MQTIVAAFNDQTTAQRAIESLVDNGFSRSAVHLQSSGTDGGSLSNDGTSGGLSSTGNGHASGTHASGEHGGMLASVEHFFKNLFSDDDDESGTRATAYSSAVRGGRSVVAVDVATDAQVAQATRLLEGLGAVDIDEEAGTSSSGSMAGLGMGGGTGVTGATGLAAGATPGIGAASRADVGAGAGLSTGAGAGAGAGGVTGATTGRSDLEGETVMPIVEEEIQVGKRTVERGGIRVLKRVTETPVSELVNLRTERATIERRPVDRPATEGDLNFQEQSIEVRERSEEAVVGKTARVVEEVVVGKEVSERSETISDTVRRTDVEVETLEGETAGGTRASDSVR